MNIEIKDHKLKGIKPICDVNFESLENLILSNSYIENIWPLKFAKFKGIKIINFACNKINDKGIKVLSNLEFKDLKELNLFANRFHNYNFLGLTKIIILMIISKYYLLVKIILKKIKIKIKLKKNMNFLF